MDKSFEIHLTKNLLVTEEAKNNCRTLHFTSEWSAEEIMSEISKFNAQTLKNLFIFEIELVKEEEIKSILDAIRTFCDKRPFIMRLGNKSDKESKIFYTNEKSNEWKEIPEISKLKEEKVEKIENFSSFFLWFVSKRNVNMNTIVTEACKVMNNPDQLTLRFLASLKLSLESRFHLLSHCAANYSKAQFLAALCIPFGSDERFLNEFQANFIKKTFSVHKKSILESAIKNENKEVLKYLISYCSHLVRQLPTSHQRKISTELIKQDKFDTLCDMLEFLDFVFPPDFDPKIFSHDRLQKIVEKRQNLHDAIKNENYDEIYEFIKFSDLKLIKNIQNKTALYTALSARKFEMYFHLKSLGFKSDDCEELSAKLENDEEMIKAKKDSIKKNLKGSISGENTAINFLAARSKIFGKHSSEEHDKIRSWLEAIYRIRLGSSILNAASQCNRLMIVFDFESDDVERVDLDSPDADGIMYPGKKLVIIAAKHSTYEQEQKVKGVLAHELCHYVMRIVFENEEKPYLNNDDERFKIYQEIVENLAEEFLNERKDDECSGIISSVFTLYESLDDFLAELVVRPIQILARYDNDQLKVKQLVRRYKHLFGFLDRLIQPIDEFDLRQREAVRTFNNDAGLMPKFLSKKLSFSVTKGLENVIDKKLVVARSNAPKLLLAHFYNQLKMKEGNLVDTKNIFIGSKEIDNSKDDLKELIEVKSLKLFIDFSSENNEFINNFLNFMPYQSLNIFFITSTFKQSQKLLEQLKGKLEETSKIIEVEIDYDWKNLTKNAQSTLLKTKVNFQNNPDMTLGKLLVSPQEIIDEKLLNAILEDSKISINSNEEEDNFHQLFTNRKFIWKNQTISLEELFDKTKNEKFVLISDVAGSGKSWAMKNISKELSRLNSTKWVTFMDLKQFIPSFKEQIQQQNFEDFIVKEILTRKSSYEDYEVEIFKQKYRTGNSIIFFDGFDEITPDSAAFAYELMKSFDSNPSEPHSSSSHNQLWISTRDFFEMDLHEELDTPFTCKLSEFTVEDGIKLISIIWRLHDFRDKKLVDFKKDVLESMEIGSYKNLGRDIILEIPANDLEGIGQPLIYKMLAEVTKKRKTKFAEGNLSKYELFEEFWTISEEDWAHKKGEYRTKKYTENKKNDLHFHRVHQLKAMQKFMPGKLEYCDIDAEDEEWTDEDLIGCGLMTKKGENYFFIHETFSEFFVAQFIVRILSKSKVDASVFEFIKEVVINQKHEVIRMFLNDGLATEQKTQAKLDKKAQKVAVEAENIENLYEVFTKNLRSFDDLGNFWFLILKHWNSEKLVEILTENIKDLIIEHDTKINENLLKIFVELITSGVDVSEIKEVIKKIFVETGLEIMPEILNFINISGENIFFVLQKTKTINEKIFGKFIKILQEFLTETEITGKIVSCNNFGESVLHSCIQFRNIQNLKTFWIGFEKILGDGQFKKLLMQKTTRLGLTILFYAAYLSKSVDFHDALWSLALKSFENQKHELKNFVFCQNVQSENFIHTIVSENNSDVLKWTLNKLKSSFNTDELREILRLKAFQGINLLQHVVKYSTRPECNEVLWTFFLEIYSNQILEIVEATDNNKENLIHFIIRFSPVETFDYYIQELEKIASKRVMRNVLGSLNVSGRNLLQCAAIFNTSIRLHESFWKILRKYFNSSEIIKFWSLQDYYGTNFINYPNTYETIEVIEFTQSEVIKEIIENYPDDLEFLENFIEAIEDKTSSPSKEFQILSLDWINRKSFSFAATRDISGLALNSDKKIHEETWNLLRQQSNEVEIQEILLKKDIFGINFVHQILRNQNLEVIQLNFENIKSSTTMKEIFDSTNSNGQNLLQYSACYAIHTSVYQYLWKLLLTYFNSDEIFDILKHKDKLGNNFLLHVATFSSASVTALTWKYINEDLKIENQKLKTLISERNLYGKNVLHLCCIVNLSSKLSVFWTEVERVIDSQSEFQALVKQKTVDQYTVLHQIADFCNNVEFHETLWKLLSRTFTDRNELKKFLTSGNDVSDNYLFYLIRCNISSDVFKFTFKACQEIFSHNQFNEILTTTDFENINLIHYALKHVKDIEIHKVFWRNFSICENFADLLASVDSKGWSVFNYAAEFSTTEILNFICEELENFNDKKEVKKILLSGRNCLAFAAGTDKDLEFHKSLWKFARKFLETTDIIQLIHSVDYTGNNLLQEAVKCNTKDIVEYTWMEVKTFLRATEWENYLKKRNGEGLNLIGITTKYNRPSEIIELIKQFKTSSQLGYERMSQNCVQIS